MWIIRGILISVFFGGSVLAVKSQINVWQKFEALVSTRTEVEKILGPPKTKLETFGVYDIDGGKFIVWYSKGGCQKDVEGLQYDVPAQKLTRLYVYVKESFPIGHYFTADQKYTKSKSLMGNERYFSYTSHDKTRVVQTIRRNDNKEVVYTVTIQPSKEQEERCLCKSEP